MKYNDNGTAKDIVIKAGDTLPVGTIVSYDGETIPSGWEEVEDNREIYSTEEQRIGTWLGKPLYRKVVTGTLTTPNINSNTWNNLTNNASELVNVYGTVAGRPYNNTIVLKDNSYVLALDVAIANNTIMYRNLGLPENSVFTLTIEYTKTTDTATIDIATVDEEV